MGKNVEPSVIQGGGGLREDIIRKYIIRQLDYRIKGRLTFFHEVYMYNACGRIDLLLASDMLLYGIEIKSDYDTLCRLQSQVVAYSHVVAYLSIVCGIKKIEKIREQVPSYVGLIVVRQDQDTGTLSHFTFRKASLNPFRKGYHIAQLLCKQEAVGLLKKKGITGTPILLKRIQLWLLLSNMFTEEHLTKVVAGILKHRRRKRYL